MYKMVIIFGKDSYKPYIDNIKKICRELFGDEQIVLGDGETAIEDIDLSQLSGKTSEKTKFVVMGHGDKRADYDLKDLQYRFAPPPFAQEGSHYIDNIKTGDFFAKLQKAAGHHLHAFLFSCYSGAFVKKDLPDEVSVLAFSGAKHPSMFTANYLMIENIARLASRDSPYMKACLNLIATNPEAFYFARYEEDKKGGDKRRLVQSKGSRPGRLPLKEIIELIDKDQKDHRYHNTKKLKEALELSKKANFSIKSIREILESRLCSDADVNRVVAIMEQRLFEKLSEGNIAEFLRHRAQKIDRNLPILRKSSQLSYQQQLFDMAITARRSPEILKALSKYGFNLERRDEFGYTYLLRCAASASGLTVARFLVENGVNINAVDNIGRTSLIHAVANNDIAMVRFLAALPGCLVNHAGKDNESALGIALKNNNYDIAAILITHGADINRADHQQMVTELMKVIRVGNLQAVRWLMARGTLNYNLIDEHGNNALMYALQHFRPEIARELVDRYDHESLSSWTNDKNESVLVMALNRGFYDLARSIIIAGANIDMPDKNGKTALIKMIKQGNHDAVKFLLENGADAELNERGTAVTPLIYACQIGNKKAARLLLSHNADPDKVNSDGDNAFEVAVRNDYPEMISVVLKKRMVSCSQVDRAMAIMAEKCGFDHKNPKEKKGDLDAKITEMRQYCADYLIVKNFFAIKKITAENLEQLREVLERRPKLANLIDNKKRSILSYCLIHGKEPLLQIGEPIMNLLMTENNLFHKDHEDRNSLKLAINITLKNPAFYPLITTIVSAMKKSAQNLSKLNPDLYINNPESDQEIRMEKFLKEIMVVDDSKDKKEKTKVSAWSADSTSTSLSPALGQSLQSSSSQQITK